MSCAVRLALIWLLSLAIPFQNAMAAGATGCAQRHHPPTTAHAESANPGHPGAHGMPGAATPHDHFAAGTADPASADADAAACVLCAGCCTGVALPSARLPNLAMASAPFTPPDTSAGTPDVVPARLERPPRSTAA